MKSRIITCGVVMVSALAAGNAAVAQNDSGASDAVARGTGFILPQSSATPIKRTLSGLRMDATDTWWGFARKGQHVELGMALAPRLGTGVPYPALISQDGPEHAVEVGPGLRWWSSAGTLSASFRFDPTGASQGDSLHLSFSRPLIAGQGFRLLAYVGAEWQTGRTATAPIAPNFVSPGGTRPVYSAGSAANVGFGLDTHYQLTRSSAIVVGASGLRFGGAPVEGALYADRWQATLYGGYSFRF